MVNKPSEIAILQRQIVPNTQIKSLTLDELLEELRVTAKSIQNYIDLTKLIVDPQFYDKKGQELIRQHLECEELEKEIHDAEHQEF